METSLSPAGSNAFDHRNFSGAQTWRNQPRNHQDLITLHPGVDKAGTGTPYNVHAHRRNDRSGSGVPGPVSHPGEVRQTTPMTPHNSALAFLKQTPLEPPFIRSSQTNQQFCSLKKLMIKDVDSSSGKPTCGTNCTGKSDIHQAQGVEWGESLDLKIQAHNRAMI